jgi:hypothetical protein
MELNQKPIAWVLCGVAVLFLAAGVVVPLYGEYWAAVFALVSPLLFFMAWSILGERLTLTTQGVYHVNRTDPIEDSVLWQDIARVELVEERSDSANRAGVSYTLVFERHEGKPLRYLVGAVSAKHMAQLRGLCEERGILARV